MFCDGFRFSSATIIRFVMAFRAGAERGQMETLLLRSSEPPRHRFLLSHRILESSENLRRFFKYPSTGNLCSRFFRRGLISLCRYSFWRRSIYFFKAFERLQFLTRAELLFFDLQLFVLCEIRLKAVCANYFIPGVGLAA